MIEWTRSEHAHTVANRDVFRKFLKSKLALASSETQSGMRITALHSSYHSTLFLRRRSTTETDAQEDSRSTSTTVSTNCYDASDHDDIRLWNGQAPGTGGENPCRDVPFLRVYRTPDRNGGLGPAVLLIPGGGYDHLTNTKEQAPVAEYFSRNLRLTTFILYYRLVQPDGTYRYPVPMWDGQPLKLIRYSAEYQY